MSAKTTAKRKRRNNEDMWSKAKKKKGEVPRKLDEI